MRTTQRYSYHLKIQHPQTSDRLDAICKPFDRFVRAIALLVRERLNIGMQPLKR
ncbi:hypothetical protein [Calothrix sp. UHCC 0171]|uniref:hypothetical protein n=1 Tax=Calothrix sp. UHCC 0171 TaxID=3110245 RepID=UPI002B203B2D|nr:hypothetical protein [Calothrix sp. UHCC 0171]MEA5571107.1 hypothetical protein [Calothrix sp. UHCC 0171]